MKGYGKMPSASERDSAYAPLEAPDALPLLSWLCFAGTLVSRPLARLLPAPLRAYPLGVVMPVAVAAGLALVGLLLAAWAMRRGRRRALARIGLFLNAVVLALTALAALGMVWIFRR
jgi:hypothetical protein